MQHKKKRKTNSMKILISSEISCNDDGHPIYHEENIDSNLDIWPSEMTIIRISFENEILRIDLKEDFVVECIKFDDGNMHSIRKKERVVSKRVGKNTLYRCFNCDKADECKYLVGESTLIRHPF